MSVLFQGLSDHRMESASEKPRRSVPPGVKGISVTDPFPQTDGKCPHSIMVGETGSGIFRIHNKGPGPQQLLAVRIAASGHLRGFHGLCLATQTSKAAGRSLDVVIPHCILKPDHQLLVQVSFSPSVVGYYRARILCYFTNGRVVRPICASGDDDTTKSLPKGRPYSRPKPNKRPSKRLKLVLGIPPPIPSFPVSLDKFKMPPKLRQQLQKKEVPPALSRGLTPETHKEYFHTLLFVEEFQMEIDIQAYDMQAVTMRETEKGFLALKVPGLAERRPSLVYRDRIFARRTGAEDKEYEGYVYSVLLEEVFVKFNSSLHQAFVPNLRFDIRFSFSRTNLRRQHQALESSVRSLSTFPKSSGPAPSLAPINRLMNQEQLSAVAEIVAKSGAPPYIIFGPPGTGKTVTVIEAILQVRRSNSAAVVLACATSNEASDLLLRRLKGAIDKRSMLRLNAFSRSWESVPSDIRDYCNDFETCPSLNTLKSYKVIVCTYMTAGILHAQGVSAGYFTHIFLDESGQGTEPETLIPVANLADKNTVVVMVGDHQQLGPVVRSSVALKFGLDRSLLQRLISSPPFSAGDARSFKSQLVTKLVKNYRSHPSILTLPSRLFYGGELVACAGEFAYSLLGWDYLPNKKFPVLFIGVEGRDEREDTSPSWFNVHEVAKVVDVVKSLREMRRNKLACKEIGVVTPYRQQVKKIKAAFSKRQMQEIDVGTVEQFQGQERRAIIISTVRSTKDSEIMSFDRKYNLGFLSNPKRFNVAVTRAQGLLVVIGNPAVLYQDACWKEFMEYCKKNNSCKGTPIQEAPVETVEDASGGFEDQAWHGAV